MAQSLEGWYGERNSCPADTERALDPTLSGERECDLFHAAGHEGHSVSSRKLSELFQRGAGGSGNGFTGKIGSEPTRFSENPRVENQWSAPRRCKFIGNKRDLVALRVEGAD
jgi:hypothetical protein